MNILPWLSERWRGELLINERERESASEKGERKRKETIKKIKERKRRKWDFLMCSTHREGTGQTAGAGQDGAGRGTMLTSLSGSRLATVTPSLRVKGQAVSPHWRTSWRRARRWSWSLDGPAASTYCGSLPHEHFVWSQAGGQEKEPSLCNEYVLWAQGLSHRTRVFPW